MEEKSVKFIEKLQELLSMAKKKKNVLERSEERRVGKECTG